METKKLKEILSVDTLTKRNGVFIAKHFYFYHHGFYSENFSNSIINSLKSNNIEFEEISSSDEFNSWPKDSWLEFRFKIKGE